MGRSDITSTGTSQSSTPTWPTSWITRTTWYLQFQPMSWNSLTNSWTTQSVFKRTALVSWRVSRSLNSSYSVWRKSQQSSLHRRKYYISSTLEDWPIGQSTILYQSILLKDTDYQPSCFQDVQSEREEEEGVEVEEEHPLPIPDLLGTHSVIPHLELNSPERSLERSRELLDEHLGTIIEAMFQLPESPVSD